MSQARIRTLSLICAIAGIGTPRETLFAPDGDGGGGGGGAPAAPAPAPAAAPAPASTPAASEGASKQESAAKERAEGLPAPRPSPRSPEEKKSAAKELKALLDAKRAADDGDDDGRTVEERRENREKGAKALREHIDEKRADGTQRQPDGKFAAKPADSAPAAEKPAQAPPQQQADKGEREQRESRLVRSLNEKTTEAETHKRNNIEMYKELKQLREEKEARKKLNPIDALEELGYSYERLTQEIVERKLLPKAQRSDLPPEVKEKLDAFDRFKSDFEAEKRTNAEKEYRTNSERAVGDFVKTNAERYPFTAALPWGVNAVVTNAINAKQANADTALAAFEKSMAETTLGLLGNERVVKALLASKPALRESLIAALGVSTSQEAKPPASKPGAHDEMTDGPSSLSSVPTGRSAAPKTRRELKSEAARGLRDFIAKRRESDD